MGDDPDRSDKAKKEEGKTSSLSSGVFSCQGKSLRMNIPLTTPSRTISALTSLVWEDLLSQSKKWGPEGNGRLSVNRAKLHRAEKMIRGAFVELYKGLGYLSTYRYSLLSDNCTNAYCAWAFFTRLIGLNSTVIHAGT